MTFLGDFTTGRVTESSLSKQMLKAYVCRLFKRRDFPKEVFIALADSIMVSKGDAVWIYSDNEHPYDFVPMAPVDELILNLPSKQEFMKLMGVDGMDGIEAGDEQSFWDNYKFEFAQKAQGVSLTWKP